jgi:hypothetical protein
MIGRFTRSRGLVKTGGSSLLELQGLDEVRSFMVDHPRRDVLKDESGERGHGSLSDTTRGTSRDRNINTGRVE